MSVISPVKRMISNWLYNRQSDLADRLIVKYSRLPWKDELLKQGFPLYETNGYQGLLQDFMDHLEEVVQPFDQTDHLQTAEWGSHAWTMEITRCLLSPSQYRTPLRRKYGIKRPEFMGCPLMHVLGDTHDKLQMHSSLSKVSSLSEKLFICQVGRVLEIVLALMVKHWSKVSCYDYKAVQREPVVQYFGSQTEIDYFDADSRKFDFGSISEQTILIASRHLIPESGLQAIQLNDHIMAAIIDGQIVKALR